MKRLVCLFALVLLVCAFPESAKAQCQHTSGFSVGLGASYGAGVGAYGVGGGICPTAPPVNFAPQVQYVPQPVQAPVFLAPSYGTYGGAYGGSYGFAAGAARFRGGAAFAVAPAPRRSAFFGIQLGGLSVGARFR